MGLFSRKNNRDNSPSPEIIDDASTMAERGFLEVPTTHSSRHGDSEASDVYMLKSVALSVKAPTIDIEAPDATICSTIKRDRHREELSTEETSMTMDQETKKAEFFEECKQVVRQCERHGLAFKKTDSSVFLRQLAALIQAVNPTIVLNQQAIADQRENAKGKKEFQAWLSKTMADVRDATQNAGRRTEGNTLFRNSIRDIEARFGTGEGAAFRFFRSIFTINLFGAILYIMFVMIPAFLTNSFPLLLTALVQSGVMSLMSPSGAILDTSLFYGSYRENYSFPIRAHGIPLGNLAGKPYKMDLALVAVYYIMIVVAFFVCVGGISNSFKVDGSSAILHGVNKKIRSLVGHTRSERRRRARIEANISELLFAGWDYRQTGDEGVKVGQERITRQLSERSNKLRISNWKLDQGKGYKFKKFFANSFALVLIVGIIIGFIFLITNLQDLSDTVSWLSPSIVPYMITLLNAIAPVIVRTIVSKVEVLEYNSTRLIHEILFTLLIKLVNMFTVLVDLKKTLDGSSMSEENSVKYRYCSTNLVGSQLWQLCVVDMFVQLVLSNGIPLLLVGTGCLPKYPFKVSVITVQIIYTYVLSTLGIIFSPGLAVFIVIINFFVFYMRKVEIMHFCRREDKPWGAAALNRFFSVLTAIVFLIMLIPIAYSLAAKVNCGPHAGVGYTQTLYNYMANVDIGIPVKTTLDDGTIESGTMTLLGLLEFMLSPIILGIISLVFGVLFFVFKGFTSAYTLAMEDNMTESDRLKREARDHVRTIKELRKRITKR
ncbi:Transmembrane channel-like protein like protein [Aduncisulcus paluster]|uniref:Transmembrane channel-like protein like protein n=1 Tax=Aduncisulcus paluster TaxID=2918883 RepID=A0ABQ5KL05_9EUKA|nr:Transmembrane channel-like protein like protein [Aduncisulcus paluster]|eukprot:gnl/Carplike_NY0171/909_a1247_1863.p1 GENE.gnl/Carplike_NY0171/909_a1247_1863~~gnl/Carplike_NY0171/909_a1247_1863.p1  ORF type:complete len:774 (+),score=184.23 gnl/Carplike_NY0171/909_a1247_1863:71-2392(+)